MWYLLNSSIIPDSQIQSNSNDFEEHHKPNITLPGWFSDKLISDFYRYENDCENNHWIEKRISHK